MNGNESQHSNYMDFTTESENERKLDRPPRNFGKKENLRSILELRILLNNNSYITVVSTDVLKNENAKMCIIFIL